MVSAAECGWSDRALSTVSRGPVSRSPAPSKSSWAQLNFMMRHVKHSTLGFNQLSFLIVTFATFPAAVGVNRFVLIASRM